MLTKAIEVTKYIRASAGRAGLSVQFENTNQPRHDGKTIFLPRITASTTEKQLKELMSSVDHEVAHERFSCFDLLQEKKLDPNSALMFVWNFLEDSRINAIEAKEYLGFRLNWDESASEIIESIIKRSLKTTSPTATLTRSLLCWEGSITAHLFPMVESVTNKVEPDKKIINVLNNYSDRLVSCQQILDKRLGTQATYQLAFDILKDLGIKNPEKQPEEVKATKKPSDSTEGEKTKSKSAEETGETGESEETGDQENDDSEYKVITVKLTEDDLKKLSLTMPTTGKKMGKVGINYEPVALDEDKWDMTDYEKFVVVNYPKNIGDSQYFVVNSASNEFISEYNKRVAGNLISQDNFAQQVRKLIQIRARVQTQYGVKKGKLDQSRLSRICFNAPGFNERVFKTRIENKTLDAAISILVDMSGSMHGSKAYYALASTLLMNEVCSTLGIPVEIVGFTDARVSSFYDTAPVMFIYKAFSDLHVSNDVLIENFAKSSRFMQGNPDGENILWAYERLLKRKERKRVFVVMSDGEPAASKSSFGLEGFTKKVIKEIQQAKKVDIYGLGLQNDSVKHYYAANDVVRTPEEIPSKLLSLIEKKVIAHV